MSNRTRAIVVRPAQRKPPRTAFKRGGPNPRQNPNSGSGRKKGVQNRFTRDVKEMLLAALHRAGGKGGGQAYFEQSARKDRRSFLAIVSKLIPSQVTGKDGGPIEVLVDRAAGNLAKLSDKELAQLQALLTKAGITEEP